MECNVSNFRVARYKSPSIHESIVTSKSPRILLIFKSVVLEMVKTFMDPVAKGFLLMTNILSTVRIDKLVVPEMIASDCRSAALECVYSGAGDDVTVRWLHNGAQVYEWSNGTESTASGVLTGRIDLSYKTSISNPPQQRTLRVIELAPEMSGDYTCVVQSRSQEARKTKTMIVFSPEHDFELTITRLTPDALNITCIAKHLYPQPDLMIEFNKIAISQQQQRIWRFGSFYDAECTAVLSARYLGGHMEVACRLQIPQVDYTVITKKVIDIGKAKNGALALLSRLTFVLVICALSSLVT